MSCDRCLDLCVKYVIRQPEQLSKAIRIAKHALSDRVLSEIDAKDDWYQYNFQECAEKMI